MLLFLFLLKYAGWDSENDKFKIFRYWFSKRYKIQFSIFYPNSTHLCTVLCTVLLYFLLYQIKGLIIFDDIRPLITLMISKTKISIRIRKYMQQIFKSQTKCSWIIKRPFLVSETVSCLKKEFLTFSFLVIGCVPHKGNIQDFTISLSWFWHFFIFRP